jgi:tRNA-2-methylthio-N6-dimethylallyladenosine synthase
MIRIDGSTLVLAAMQREYRGEEHLERIAWIKVARRPISIPTDMIVSFPGESEEDSDQTLSLAAEVGFDAVLAFKFLPRPNTPAISLADSIPEQE